MNHIKEIYSYRDMIRSLAQRELRGKYEKSVLGFLWSFLSPLFQIIIYNMVFTMVFHNDMPHYYIYLMTGLLPWTFFADSLAQATGAIKADQYAAVIYSNGMLFDRVRCWIQCTSDPSAACNSRGIPVCTGLRFSRCFDHGLSSRSGVRCQCHPDGMGLGYTHYVQSVFCPGSFPAENSALKSHDQYHSELSLHSL